MIMVVVGVLTAVSSVFGSIARWSTSTVLVLAGEIRRESPALELESFFCAGGREDFGAAPVRRPRILASLNLPNQNSAISEQYPSPHKKNRR
jgi:hypothetical protein